MQKMIKKYFDNRKTVIALILILLVICATAGGTLAYLGSVTGEKENVFTGAENIRARLSEPNWEEAEGLKLVPGKKVKKDPMITNTGMTDEYAAIRLTFQDKEGETLSDPDLKSLLNLLDITWNSKWKLCGGTMTITSGEVTAMEQPLIFYYEEALSPGEISDPVFSNIRVKDQSDGLTEQQLRWLQGIKIVNGEIKTDTSGIGSFAIQAEGSAVQALGFADAAAAADSLKALFPPL